MYREPWPRPVVHFGARFRRYNNSKKYFGGVHGFTEGTFPGYPNGYWGWGGEDDALRKRVDLRSVTFACQGEYLDLEGFTTAKEKLRTLNEHTKCMNRWELLKNDNPSADNHRKHNVQFDVTWHTESAKVTTGKVYFADKR